MSGWLILVALAACVAAGLFLIARPGRPQAMLVAAAMLIAFAGYTWQGRPDLAGKPTRPQDAPRLDGSPFADERKALLETVGPDVQALDAADQLIRTGDADYAIGTLRATITRRPGSMMLWLGLGNALVHQANGLVTPPARFAFDRAAALAPGHPAPAYFLGLAYAVSGDLKSADTVWTAAIEHMPADPRWRDRLIARLFLLRQIERGASDRN